VSEAHFCDIVLLSTTSFRLDEIFSQCLLQRHVQSYIWTDSDRYSCCFQVVISLMLDGAENKK